MTTVSMKTPAKINLILNILAERTDNYHNIETIFQTISLYDTITVDYQPSSKTEITIESNSTEIPTDKTNLVWQATEQFLKKTNVNGDFKINITKNIPVAAGLAGGSSDAACILKILNTLTGYKTDDKDLLRIAYSLGADVSFLLKGGTATGKGIGDILDPIETPELFLVLVKPENITISSGQAYQAYDKLPVKPDPADFNNAIKAVKSNNARLIAENLFNSFEYSVYKKYPELEQLKQKLLKSGCLGALLSGSGSAIYGIAESESHAQEIKKLLQDKTLKIWVVKTTPAE